MISAYQYIIYSYCNIYYAINKKIQWKLIEGSFTYPNRLMKDRYAGSKTSATASLRDSLSSVSGTVHWDCLWWRSSNWILNVFNLENRPRLLQSYVSRIKDRATSILEINNLKTPVFDDCSRYSTAISSISTYRTTAPWWCQALNREAL